MTIKGFAPRLWLSAIAVSLLSLAATGLAEASGLGGGQGGVLNLSSASTMLTNVISFIMGPVAKLVATLCIIGGALAFAQGRELNEGLKNIGIIGIVVGLLSAASSMLQNWTIGGSI